MADRKGWRETLRYYYFKLVRQSGDPEYLAKGCALGLFIGLLIPMSFQIVIVLPLAVLFKASKVLAVAFTFVTNWVTVIFIYPLQCLVGSYLIFRPLKYETLKIQFGELLKIEGVTDFMRALFKLGMDIAIPFFVGGLFFGLIASVIGYRITLALVRNYRRRKEQRRIRRAAQRNGATNRKLNSDMK